MAKPTELREKPDLSLMIGRGGKTVTPMIPSGRIRIEDSEFEAISVEGMVDK